MSRAADYGTVPPLPPELALLVRVSAAIGSGRDDVLDESLRAALERTRAGGPPSATAVEEMLLQSHLFAGYPATIRALEAWRRLAGAPEDPIVEADVAEWAARGEAVCARVYGGQYERLRHRVAALHPELDRWMVRDGYGRVLGRPGLPLPVREMCVVALLCAQDSEAQLYSHLRGARQVGVSEEQVEAVLHVAGELVPAARREAAWRVWTTLLARPRRRKGRLREGDPSGP